MGSREGERERERMGGGEEEDIVTLIMLESTKISTPSPSSVPTTALYSFVTENYKNVIND